MTVLTDPRYLVPPLPAGAGPLDRLRRSVPRFANGPGHDHRRAEAVRLLDAIPLRALRAGARARAAAALATRPPDPAAATGPAPGAAWPFGSAAVSGSAPGAAWPTDPAPGAARLTDPVAARQVVPGPAAVTGAARPTGPTGPAYSGRLGGGGPAGGEVALLVPGVPVEVLAAALGVADPVAVAGLVPAVAAAYFPGSAGSVAAADRAVGELLGMGVDAVRTGLLVQACEPVAALVRAALARGDADLAAVLAAGPPVPATRRWRPDTGEAVTVPLAGIPFGAGPRRCPAEPHALALAAGVLDAVATGPEATR